MENTKFFVSTTLLSAFLFVLDGNLGERRRALQVRRM